MARPTNAAKIDRATVEAEELIKANLVKLTQVLLEAALNSEESYKCRHCGKTNNIERVGDPRVALSLLERVAGKATDRKDPGPGGGIQELLLKLNEAGKTAASPTTLSPAAQAQVKQALQGARVHP